MPIHAILFSQLNDEKSCLRLIAGIALYEDQIFGKGSMFHHDVAQNFIYCCKLYESSKQHIKRKNIKEINHLIVIETSK